MCVSVSASAGANPGEKTVQACRSCVQRDSHPLSVLELPGSRGVNDLDTHIPELAEEGMFECHKKKNRSEVVGSLHKIFFLYCFPIKY